MSSPRTAVYINRVSKAYSAVRILQIDAGHHAARMDFEKKYAAEPVCF